MVYQEPRRASGCPTLQVSQVHCAWHDQFSPLLSMDMQRTTFTAILCTCPVICTPALVHTLDNLMMTALDRGQQSVQNFVGAPATLCLLPCLHAALHGQGRHLLEDSSILLHLIKFLLLVQQGLPPVGQVHVPQGQGRLLGLLALPLLALHPLQPCQPTRKVLQLCVPLPHLPARFIAPASTS